MSSPSLSPLGSDNTRTFPDAILLGAKVAPRVIVPRALISKILSEVDDGIRLLRHGGAEVGGLLIGIRLDSGDIRVDEAISLRTEYQYGPVFQLSDSDFAGVETSIASLDFESQQIVGFYRSATRGDDGLRESDQELLEALNQIYPDLAEIDCCLLFAAPSRVEASIRVYVRLKDGWRQSKLRCHRDTLEISPVFEMETEPSPDSVSDQAPEEDEAVPLASGLAPLEPDERAEGAGVPFPVRIQQSLNLAVLSAQRLGVYLLTLARGHRLRAPILVLIALLALTGVYRWINSRQHESAASQSGPPKDVAQLGFAASPDGRTWKLTWNRDAVYKLDPAGAILTIVDGDNQRQIALTNEDISSGVIYYSPHAGELDFRLAIRKREGDLVEERVRVLDGLMASDTGPEQAQRSDRQPVANPAPAIIPNAASSNRSAARGFSQPTIASNTAPTRTNAPANVPFASPPAGQPATAAGTSPAVNGATPAAGSPVEAGNRAGGDTSSASNAQAKDAGQATSTERAGETNPPSGAGPSREVTMLAVPVPPPAVPVNPPPPANQAPPQAAPPEARPPQTIATTNAPPEPTAATNAPRQAAAATAPPEPSATAAAPPPTITKEAPKEPSNPPTNSTTPVRPAVASAPNAPPPAARPPTPRQSSYLGPKPIVQVAPSVPQGVPIRGTPQVQVLVAIDAKGKVIKATPLGSENVSLTVAATKAAMFWTFDPARQDGKAVASEMTLIFRF